MYIFRIAIKFYVKKKKKGVREPSGRPYQRHPSKSTSFGVELDSIADAEGYRVESAILDSRDERGRYNYCWHIIQIETAIKWWRVRDFRIARNPVTRPDRALMRAHIDVYGYHCVHASSSLNERPYMDVSSTCETMDNDWKKFLSYTRDPFIRIPRLSYYIFELNI